MENYRNRLIRIVKTLEETDISLFTEALNTVMENELKESSDVFNEGEIFEFNINVLLTRKDVNVQKTAAFILKVIELKENLINLNKITEEDLVYSISEIRTSKFEFRVVLLYNSQTNSHPHFSARFFKLNCFEKTICASRWRKTRSNQRLPNFATIFGCPRPEYCVSTASQCFHK